jgi:hypothetical protein
MYKLVIVFISGGGYGKDEIFHEAKFVRGCVYHTLYGCINSNDALSPYSDFFVQFFYDNASKIQFAIQRHQ